MPASSLEFALLVDAVKLPSPTVVPPGARYEVSWYYSDEHRGTSTREAANADEVNFMMSAKWLVDARRAPGKVLQLSVHQHTADGESESVGMLMIDTSAHIPKPPQRISRQRATLTMSRSLWEAPVMIRLTVECVHSHMSVQTRTSSNSPQMSLSTTPQPTPQSVRRDLPSPATSGIIPIETDLRRSSSPPAAIPINTPVPHHFDATPVLETNLPVEQEVARLRATIGTMASANEQLRDENRVLRKAASQARKEGDYTYTVDRPVNEAPEELTQRAEMAVLQRGVTAAKEQLRTQMEREQELRAEITSLERTNKEQLSTIHGLEANLEALRISQVTASDAKGGEVETLREHLYNTQKTLKDITAAQRSSDNTVETLRGHLTELQKEHTVTEQKYAALRRESTTTIAENQTRVERMEAALRLGQKEIERLHKYCQETNERCAAFAKAFEGQREVIEKKKKKISDLKSLLAAQQGAMVAVGAAATKGKGARTKA